MILYIDEEEYSVNEYMHEQHFVFDLPVLIIIKQMEYEQEIFSQQPRHRQDP
jgi:hypothetical protein